MATEPQKLGKYNIVGKIGKGAMGEVYKGHDPVLNRFVAIKIIAETLGTDSDLVERFKREARNAAQLNHPNIITIYDFVEEEGHLYMVMELLEGQDLKELIKSGAPVTMEQILSIMEQIADGLGFAHSRGVIHRDLKPANIHVSKNGQVKILDFGLVHEASSDMTKTGQVMGTPNYMSPEQVQGLRVDPRSDIFSLGAVFYELLTRKKPFGADSIHATMFKVVQGDREPLGQYTHLPKPLINLVDRALDKDPEGRFADASALRDHLRVLRRAVMRGKDAESTFTGSEEMTIVTPAAETGSITPASHEKSGPSRSGPQASASASRGTLRKREAAASSVSALPAPAKTTPVALYVLAGALVLAVGGGAYFMTRGTGSGQHVEALSQALLASQLELMERSLSQKDYGAALSQAEELLKTDPANADALRVQGEAREALQRIDNAVAQARNALEGGAMQEAADALATVLALDPSHPLGVELSAQLSQHFQSQAEHARSEMEASRSAAQSAGAQERPEYVMGDRARQQATDEFNRGVFTNAAQKYLEARDLFQHSRSQQQQQQTQKRAQTEREQETGQQARAAREALEGRLRQAESAWSRLRQAPADAALTQQPSYQRAMTEEGVAARLKATGDLDGAAGAYENATSHLERARRELGEAEARRAREEETRRVAAAATTAPPTTSAPTRAQDEAAIRQVLVDYERAIETKNIALFREIKPNLSAAEEKRLTDAFRNTDSQDVEITVNTIVIEGDSATVAVTRRDIIVVRGRSQNGNSRPQSFVLSRTGGKWVIVQIGQ
ncbi:MAG TPA: protein kinase [Vicinamibacteria bacterium]|nr:protein kinase [Vicinamibacteria bacterium]